MQKNFSIILYYNFSPVKDPQAFCKEHYQACSDLDLLGRIYVAAEGINGTLAGRIEKIERYKTYLRGIKGFEKTEFKEDFDNKIPFERLIVKTRPEIVTLKSSMDVDPHKDGGGHLSPEEWKKALESKEDYTLIDVRNNYESEIGHFEGALRPDVENFYDFPAWLESAKIDKGKKVLMYCTGGIRCEKFSAYMKKKGFKHVDQLHGGILNYAKKVGSDHYKGKCFVFDDRLSVPVEENQKELTGKCKISGVPCDTYINCSNLDCNSLFLCARQAAIEMEGCCSQECKKAKWKRPFNPDDVYAPSRRWYHYYEDKELSQSHGQGKDC